MCMTGSINDYYADTPKPVVNGEPAYEEIGIWFNPANPRHDDYEIRKQAYWSVFAGAFGHTYGNNNIWQMNREDEPGRIWPNRILGQGPGKSGGRSTWVTCDD